MIFAVMLAVVAPAAQTLPVVHQETGTNGKQVLRVDPFPESQSQEVQTKLDGLAKARCGRLTLRWGRFNYDTRAGTANDPDARQIINYRQEFRCIDPATDPYKPAPPGWTASAADNAAALAYARRYMAAVDALNVDSGLSMMETEVEATREEWLKLPQALKQSAGAGSRTFAEPRWLLDPEGAGHPGIYATITFRGTYSGLYNHCGYLMLYRDGAGHYKVSQQNFRALTREDVSSGRVSRAAADAACEGY